MRHTIHVKGGGVRIYNTPRVFNNFPIVRVVVPTRILNEAAHLYLTLLLYHAIIIVEGVHSQRTFA